MRATRRNVLVILGVLTIAGGALFGTGAFTQVEAQRSVDVTVANDSEALVGMEANSSYVDYDGDGAVQVDLTNFESAQGVNVDANTTLKHGILITNNGDDWISLSGEPWEAGTGSTTVTLDANTTDLDPGDTAGVDVIVNTNGATADDSVTSDVEIVATSN